MALQNKYDRMSNSELANELLTHNLYTGTTPRDADESKKIINAIHDRLTGVSGRMYNAQRHAEPASTLATPVDYTWEFHLNPVLTSQFAQFSSPQTLENFLAIQQPHNPLVTTPVIAKILNSHLLQDSKYLQSTMYSSDIFITIKSDESVTIDIKARVASPMFMGGMYQPGVMMPQFNMPGFMRNRSMSAPDNVIGSGRFGSMGPGPMTDTFGEPCLRQFNEFAPGVWDESDDKQFPPKLTVVINDLVLFGMLDVFEVLTQRLVDIRDQVGGTSWAENIGSPASIVSRFQERLEKSKAPYDSIDLADWLFSIMKTNRVTVKVFDHNGPVSVEVVPKLMSYGQTLRATALEFQIGQDTLKAPMGVLADIQHCLKGREIETNPLILWPKGAGTADSVFQRIKEAVATRLISKTDADIEAYIKEQLETTPLFVRVFDADGPVEVGPVLRLNRPFGSAF
jgi:hypothetical protein